MRPTQRPRRMRSARGRLRTRRLWTLAMVVLVTTSCGRGATSLGDGQPRRMTTSTSSAPDPAVAPGPDRSDEVSLPFAAPPPVIVTGDEVELGWRPGRSASPTAAPTGGRRTRCPMSALPTTSGCPSPSQGGSSSPRSGPSATTPAAVAARALVQAANGEASVVDFTPVRPPCQPEGSVWFRGDESQVRRVATLGPPPFTYDIELSLDGTLHRSTATWPEDVDPECAPCVPLLGFDPPLPRLGDR